MNLAEKLKKAIETIAPNQSTDTFRVQLLKIIEEHTNQMDTEWMIWTADQQWTLTNDQHNYWQSKPEFYAPPITAEDLPCFEEIGPFMRVHRYMSQTSFSFKVDENRSIGLSYTAKSGCISLYLWQNRYNAKGEAQNSTELYKSLLLGTDPFGPEVADFTTAAIEGLTTIYGAK